MKRFLKHFGFAIAYEAALLIIGFAPDALFDTNEPIPFWAVLFYNVLWFALGAHVYDRIVKWRK